MKGAQCAEDGSGDVVAVRERSCTGRPRKDALVWFGRWAQNWGCSSIRPAIGVKRKGFFGEIGNETRGRGKT